MIETDDDWNEECAEGMQRINQCEDAYKWSLYATLVKLMITTCSENSTKLQRLSLDNLLLLNSAFQVC